MLTRRHLLSAFAALPVAAGARSAWAEEIVQLDWRDLIPKGSPTERLRTLQQLGIVQHGELDTGFQQETNVEMTEEYNGKLVRLPGYIVPLEFDVTSVKTFILAPFVGACIHVPPPPANQLVLVTSETPYGITGLYDAVYVTGIFGTAASATALADIGYAISADKVEPYS